MGRLTKVEIVLTEHDARLAACKLFLDGLEAMPKLAKATSYPLDVIKRWRVEDQWDRRKLQMKAAEMAVDLKKFGFNPSKNQVQFFKMCKIAMRKLENRLKNHSLSDSELRGLVNDMETLYGFQKRLMDDIPKMITQQAQLDRASQFDKVEQTSIVEV